MLFQHGIILQSNRKGERLRMTQEAMNRRKMVAIMENYTEALIEKNPQALPLAAGCRATYNGKECQIGENPLWKNTLIIKQRQTFIDPVSGEMVFFGVMSNEPREMNETFPVNIHVYSKQYLATIRLKIVDGKITEIEELTIDKRLRYFYADSEEVNAVRGKNW